MSWLVLALIPALLFAVSNFIDKYLLERYFKEQGNGALIIFSSLIGIVALPIIFILDTQVVSVSLQFAALASANGILYVLALLPYFVALRDEDASSAVPIWQLIPVFGYVLGYFLLGEELTALQMGAGAIIILGAIGLSVDLQGTGEGLQIKWKTFFLMALSSALMALNGVLFKVFALDTTYAATIFWDSVGLVLIGLAYLIFAPVSRREFIEVFRSNSRGALALNGINEVVNIIAMFVLNYSLLLAPVALIFLANAAQPLFVFVIGITLTLLVPKIISEDMSKKVLVQKGAAILVLVIGAFLMDYVS